MDNNQICLEFVNDFSQMLRHYHWAMELFIRRSWRYAVVFMKYQNNRDSARRMI